MSSAYLLPPNQYLSISQLSSLVIAHVRDRNRPVFRQATGDLISSADSLYDLLVQVTSTHFFSLTRPSVSLEVHVLQVAMSNVGLTRPLTGDPSFKTTPSGLNEAEIVDKLYTEIRKVVKGSAYRVIHQRRERLVRRVRRHASTLAGRGDVWAHHFTLRLPFSDGDSSACGAIVDVFIQKLYALQPLGLVGHIVIKGGADNGVDCLQLITFTTWHYDQFASIASTIAGVWDHCCLGGKSFMAGEGFSCWRLCDPYPINYGHGVLNEMLKEAICLNWDVFSEGDSPLISIGGDSKKTPAYDSGRRECVTI